MKHDMVRKVVGSSLCWEEMSCERVKQEKRRRSGDKIQQIGRTYGRPEITCITDKGKPIPYHEMDECGK